jgi:hypothetical protein
VLARKASVALAQEFLGIANITTGRGFWEHVVSQGEDSCTLTNDTALYDRVLESHFSVSLKEVVEDDEFKLGLVCARSYMPELAVETVDLVGKMLGTVLEFVKQKKKL